MQQIGTLTGKKYLGDYGSDMEQFAALMNAGAVVAEAMDLKVGVALTAGKNLTLNANDVDIVTVAKEKHVAVAYGSSSAEIHDVQHQQSALSGENIRLNTKKDISIAGGILSAKNDVELNAKGDVNLTAGKDLYSEESEVGNRGGSYYNHNKQVDEAVKGTTIAAKNDISIASGKDINIKGSNVASEAGKADLIAENNVNIANETEYHERLHEEHNKVSGLLSSKTTDIYDYSKQNTVVGSNVSAGEIAINSKKDTNITGSNVVADNDVNVETGGSLNIGSAEQTSESEYIKSVKKSGILSGGGLGFTIGKEKQKDQYANQNTEQVGSTVGSVKGNVNLDADKAANVKGSTVVAGKDINITGENVSIENSNNIYNAQEKHEFKRTGLSVSVGGGYVDVVNNAANSVKHATEVEDKRLGALVAVKGYKDADKAIKDIKGKGGGKINENLSVNISLGTTKSRSESNSTTTVANASEVKAGGDINVTSTKKDINITGSNVEGKDVTLNAKENLNITASKNTNKTEQNSKSSSASVGASLELGKGPSYSISGSMSKGEVSANGTTYNESNVTANKDLSFASGNDTNIKGGNLSGEKVTGNVGGDLNIESKQDSNSYKENNKSVGASIGLGSNKAVSGSASVGKIDSNYKSVTDQSGIYAGKDGFDIRVEANTDLKGGIISSTADVDKNKLSTGTLTFEDIQNKADYKAGGAGIKVNKNNDAEYNEKGITPDIGMPASGEAESTTKATISKGTIEIRDKENQKQDINKLNRDNANSLNKLGEIFDKTKIEERQKLANLFGELAYNEIHKLAERNNWQEGCAEKNALHALVGGIMSELTGNGFLSGASASTVNEMVQKKLSEQFEGEPDKHQWASAIIGGVVSQLVAGKAQAGASTAASGTKNNRLSLSQYEEFKKRLSEAKSNAERIEIYEKYLKVDLAKEKELVEKLKDQNFVNGLIKALEENPDLEIYDGVVIKGFSVVGDRDNNNYLSEGTGEILDDTHEKFIFHAEHPLYNSETGTTDLVSHLQKFINDNKEELQSLGKNVTMSYLTNGVDKIIDKLPDKISASPKACDVYVNGIKVLKSVSSSVTITIGEGVYDIYVDYNKYHGTTLALNTVSTVSTVALSLTVSNKLQNNFSDTLGYMLPLVDGGFAFLISQGSSKIKHSISEGDK